MQVSASGVALWRDFMRAKFEHTCFKTLDDLGRHEEAWAALPRCNVRMHSLNPYRADAEEEVVAALTGMPAIHIPPLARQPGSTPIFIVGMPRSGTTVLDPSCPATRGSPRPGRSSISGASCAGSPT